MRHADDAKSTSLQRKKKTAKPRPTGARLRHGESGAKPTMDSVDQPRPELVACPECDGDGRNPDAPDAIADDEGTCLTCCYPLHPRYAAFCGHVQHAS